MINELASGSSLSLVCCMPQPNQGGPSCENQSKEPVFDDVNSESSGLCFVTSEGLHCKYPFLIVLHHQL